MERLVIWSVKCTGLLIWSIAWLNFLVFGDFFTQVGKCMFPNRVRFPTLHKSWHCGRRSLEILGGNQVRSRIFCFCFFAFVEVELLDFLDTLNILPWMEGKLRWHDGKINDNAVFPVDQFEASNQTNDKSNSYANDMYLRPGMTYSVTKQGVCTCTRRLRWTHLWWERIGAR